MDIIQFIAQFFYRIRYWLLWGGFVVTVLVAYFTQFLPFSYTVNSNIYAGVTNVVNIDGSKIENISSTFDNLINIAKSKSTLEKVSLRLLIVPPWTRLLKTSKNTVRKMHPTLYIPCITVQ